MRIGSLFTGYGGLELATSAVLDTEISFVADNDPAASLVLDARFPDVPNIGDVTRVDWTTVPPVDVLTGGTPCQDLSHAGKRLGMSEGTRSNLWVQMREAIATLRPELVIWENVRGAISAAADSAMELCSGCMGARHRQPPLRALGRVLGDLADLGMDAAWTGIRASEVGAPHRRLRIFLIAWDPERRTTSHARAGRVNLRKAAAELPSARRLRVQDNDLPAILPTPTTWDGKNVAGRSTFNRHTIPLSSLALLLPTPVVNDMGERKTIEWWDEWAPRQISSSGAKAPHGPSLSVEARRGSQAWGRYSEAIQRWERLTRDAPPPVDDRGDDDVLSPRFVEWMMGLPDGWVCDVPGLTPNAMKQVLGNGVVPQQGATALDELLRRRDTL